MATRAAWSLLALAAALAGCGDVIRTVKQTMAVGKTLQRQIDQLSPNDDVRRRLRGLADRGKGDSVNILVVQGLPRLDSATLVRRVVVLHQMLTNVDEPLCAALARGTPSEAQMTLAMVSLDSAALDEWMAVIVKSMIAAVEKHDFRTVAEEDVATALDAVVERLPDGDGERLMDALGTLEEVGDTDACWSGRVLYREILALSEPDRTVLARGLVQP